MKVQGGAPGQILDMDEIQERRRAEDANKTRRKFGEQATGLVHHTVAAPSPKLDRNEEETRQSFRRFMDWAASLAERSPRQKENSERAAKAYSQCSRLADQFEKQKGQRISRMA